MKKLRIEGFFLSDWLKIEHLLFTQYTKVVGNVSKIGDHTCNCCLDNRPRVIGCQNWIVRADLKATVDPIMFMLKVGSHDPVLVQLSFTIFCV